MKSRINISFDFFPDPIQTSFFASATPSDQMPETTSLSRDQPTMKLQSLDLNTPAKTEDSKFNQAASLAQARPIFSFQSSMQESFECIPAGYKLYFV